MSIISYLLLSVQETFIAPKKRHEPLKIPLSHHTSWLKTVSQSYGLSSSPVNQVGLNPHAPLVHELQIGMPHSWTEFLAPFVSIASGELTVSNGIDGHRNSGFSHEK